MTTIVLFNGWHVDPLAGWRTQVEHLHARLTRETLDPTFERYGDFCTVPERSWIEAWTDHPVHGASFAALDRSPGVALHFHGNFWSYSHAFSLVSDDETVIVPLVTAIRANKATVAYKEARDERQAQDDYWAVQERRRREEADADARRRVRAAR